MTTRLENFLNMVRRVRLRLTQGAAIMTPVNKYTETNTSLEGHYAEAETAGMQQQSNSTGKAILKNQRRNELVDILIIVVKVLIAYATFEDNPEMLRQVKKSKGKLRKMAINSLKGFAQEIHDLANSINADLLPYGLAVTTIASLRGAIEAFELVMQTPQFGKDTRKQLTNQLKMLRKAMETDLGKMDTLVDLVMESEPVFHAEYFNDRRIDDIGVSKVALTAKATDAATGLGLKSVKFTFSLNENGGNKAGTDLMKSVKRTGNKGVFMMKTMPEGTYLCTVEYEGYIAQTFNVYVNMGVLTRVNVELQRAA